MMKCKFFILPLVLFQMTLEVSAQTISGKVTSQSDGSPLIGATVQIKGSTNGTITDISGNYLLPINTDDTLVFSYIGYESKTLAIGGQVKLNVALSEDFTEMEEVIIVAYGTVRKSDHTGSISSCLLYTSPSPRDA